MRALRYSINVTLDGCCDHRAIPADEDLHRHYLENLIQAMPSSWTGSIGTRSSCAGIWGRAVQPRLAGHGPTLFAGLSRYVDLRLASRLELASGGGGDAV